MPFGRGSGEAGNALLLLRAGRYKLLLQNLLVHRLQVVPVPLSDQLLLVLHLSVTNMKKALV